MAVHTFSSCGEWGLLFTVVHKILTGVISLVEEPGLRGTQDSVVAAQGLWRMESAVVVHAACGTIPTRDRTSATCIESTES